MTPTRLLRALAQPRTVAGLPDTTIRLGTTRSIGGWRSSVIVPLITVLLGWMTAPAVPAAGFRAGAAVVDISPTQFPVIVNAMFTERTATQTVDRLNVRALVLDDGSTRIGLAVVDTCMMPRDLIDQAKSHASRETGIPPDHLLVSATHTHSAPAAMGCLGSRVDPRYAAYLPGRIAEAIVRAHRRLAPARIGWSVVDDWDHTFNRRWIRRPDRLIQDPFGQPTVRAHMHPGHRSPDAIGPSGPVDPGLSVIALSTPEGAPIAVLANYSQHYYGSPLLSSDYYGRFADHLTHALSAVAPADEDPAGDKAGFVAIMSQGTSGDLMWMDYGAPSRDIGYDAYAREMADRVAEVVRGIAYRDSVPLKMAERRLSLNYRVPDPDRLAWAQAMADKLGDRLPGSLPEIYALEALHLHARPRTELVVQALRIGDLGIATMPNEVFALTGLKVKAMSPLRPTFTIELANGAEGYIPPPEQHVLGGYTTWPARTAGLEVQAEPRIVDAVLGLLEEVSGLPRRPAVAQHGPYARAVLASRPIAYWRLDDMTVPTAVDATPHARHASLEDGIALFLPGAGSGTGLSPQPALVPSAFSGPDQINRSIHTAGGRLRAHLPTLADTYSVEFWFWNGLTNTARPVTAYLFSRGADGDSAVRGDHLGVGGTHSADTTGRLFFFNGHERNQVLAGRTLLADRTWHHVVLVRDGGQVRVHLNGRLEPEIVGTADLTRAPGSASPEVFLGGRNDRFAGLEGRLDEAAIYDRALGPVEIARHYQESGLSAPVQATLPHRPASPALSPEASMAKIRLRDGFRVELVATEPLVIDPVAIDWDTAGRIWVVEMADYPMGMNGQGKPGGRVRILEDADGDGRPDHARIFADGLNFPNGILTWRDGVIVTAAPEVLFLKDTDGDGRADVRQVLLSGFLEGNQQLRVNGLRWGLDNWVYCAAGGHHRGHGAGTVIRSVLTGLDVPLGSRDLRFRPDTGALEPESGPTQFGRNRDDWGHWFGTQNSWPLWHFVLPDPYLRRNPHVAAPDPVRQILLPMNPRVFPVRGPEKRYHSFEQAGHFTSACGGMIYRDDLLFPFSDTLHGFVCEPVHNLVHHALVRDDDVSFTGQRAPEEAASDFLASEDPWFRPVMVREGPDGALWVIDMYRYMIEHPDWLPQEGRDELLPHYREGDDRGRLYRVFPAHTPPRRAPRLDRLNTVEQVEALDSPNGWQRDKIHQLLLWRNDPAAVPLLQRMVRQHSNPRARVHALGVLDGMDRLRPDLVETALKDDHPGVRENAVRVAERAPTPEIIAAVARLANDPSPKVRLQVAFTLGEWQDTSAGAALAQLATSSANHPWLTAAVLSSAVPHLAVLVNIVRDPGSPVAGSLRDALLQIALALQRRDSLAQLIEPILTPLDGRFVASQMTGLREVLDRITRAGTSPDQLAHTAGRPDRLTELLSSRSRLIDAAARLSDDSSAPPADRIAAASLLTREPTRRPAALAALAGWLKPQVPVEIQLLALSDLAATGAPEIADLVLSGWPGFGPAVRERVLDTLSNRREWALRLVQALTSGEVNPHALDAPRRTRLLRYSDGRVRQGAEAVLESSGRPTDRQDVIERFRPALNLQGDASRAAAVYAKLCLQCHQRDGQGGDVGPNLSSVVEHPPEKLLVNILDPNSDVQPGYHAYQCTLVDGEELYGRIAAETATSVILQLADGSRRTIARTDLAEMHGSQVSLMPEGLEEGLTPQDVADLIALLRTRPPTP